jgi:hypothetical protein
MSSPQDSDAALPPVALLQLAAGHQVSRALALIAKLGIADLIGDGRRSVEDLAAATRSHAPSLGRVMRLLVAAGVFDEDDQGALALTATGQLLRDEVAGSMRPVVSLMAGEATQAQWADLEYCVRTGQPAFRKHDPEGDAFASLAADPQAAADFDRAMAAFASRTAAAIAAAYDLSRCGVLVDVGGGNGALLAGLAAAVPTLRGILFDLPHVVERARAALPPTERIELVAGSFFDGVPAGGDAYLLKHVIHDWGDADAARILRACHRAMPPHGVVLIVEAVYPARIDSSPAARDAVRSDVSMLVATGGRTRSAHEFLALLASSGLALSRIVPTAAGASVIEAVRA